METMEKKKTYDKLPSLSIFLLLASLIAFFIYPVLSSASEPWGIYVERIEDAEGLE